ncbi:MAG TPA: hypothetical protein VME92_13165 [Acetobacteraceae bacterium]|nr:hypothetical protein [Acetobacteraceae bacterium]
MTKLRNAGSATARAINRSIWGARGRRAVPAAAGAILAALLLAAPPAAAPARAQASGMAGIGQSDTVTERATVQSVDLAQRQVTLVGPRGGVVTLKVPDTVRNLAQVKPGDTVIAHYHASVTYVLSPRGTRTPRNSLTTGAARAAPGEMPAGAAGARLVVTGLVVGIDQAAHQVQVVSPEGGPVRTIDVVTPAGQRSLPMVKVGDTITAISTAAVLVAVEPAH